MCQSPPITATRVLRVPSTDHPEALPPDRNMRIFYNASPKIRGALPSKKLGAKNMQNSVNFGPLQTFISIISGTAEDTQNRPALQTMAIPPAFNGKGPVNFGPLTAQCEFGPTKMHFFGRLYFSP